MDCVEHLSAMCTDGRIAWAEQARGFIGDPEEILRALASDGFQEYKREVARSPRARRPTGGVWQGLDAATGAVASAIWIARPAVGHTLVFVDVDGRPVEVRPAATPHEGRVLTRPGGPGC
ncbi:MAG: hypothetical protein HY615_08755 [Candidatus Rokubacteria bacterium]|nr:hypothetical protein [Candidatus Rokubacteria bacterium]